MTIALEGAIRLLDAIMLLADPSPDTPLRGLPPSPTRGEGKKDQWK
jgi:hypothetical protein